MIRVNEKYVINVDALNYTAQIDTHCFTKKGDPIYKTVGYYSTLKDAVIAIADRESREMLAEGETTLGQAVNTLVNTHKEFMKIVNEAIKESAEC